MTILIKSILFVLIVFSSIFSQSWDEPLKIFGYFQNEFEYQKGTAEADDFDQNTFVLQQLNLFVQKDFAIFPF